VSPDEVRGLDELLTEHGLETRLHIIIETNAGLEACYEIAQSSPRIDAMFFGGVDMAAELRAHGSWEALLYARSRVVHAAAGAGLDVIDVPYLDLGDLPGMEVEARAAAELGFTGKGSIHPKQIPALNAIFAPGPEAVAHARRVVDAFAAAESGLVVLDNKLIEKPVLRTMHRTLRIAERIAARQGTK
jgi:(S)-citramalyl-CoA lyase